MHVLGLAFFSSSFPSSRCFPSFSRVASVRCRLYTEHDRRLVCRLHGVCTQAGHGAANVTMGIPRLRELLQRGAVTKTPILYIPIRTEPFPSSGSLDLKKKKKNKKATGEGEEGGKDGWLDNGEGQGDNEEEDRAAAILTRNTGIALRGFTTIRLSDCVHSLGVEANVCYHVRQKLDFLFPLSLSLE